MELHDAIYAQILGFKYLHEIVFDGTVISYYTHKLLSLIPTLRILTIIDCKFLRTPFAEYNRNLISTDPQTSSLFITHLSLYQLVLPDPDSNFNQMKYNHFLLYNNIPTLSSLSITWTQEFNTALIMFLEQFLGDEERWEDAERWIFPNLAHIDVILPIITRFDYLRTISWFIQDHCPLRPRVQLTIKSHNISERQISRLRVSMPGLWNYNGPHCILFRIRTLTDLTHVTINDPMTKVLDNLMKLPETLQSLDIKIKDWEDGLHYATDILDMFPTIRYAYIRYNDDRYILSLCPESLEMEIAKWDIEALFTARYRFPAIHSLTIRYGGDAIRLGHRFIVRLGTEILFHLPHLHTLKLVNDATASPTANTHELQRFTFSSHYSDNEPDLALDDEDLEDYLNAWNRDCKQFRHLEVTADSRWVRKFDGDQWVKKNCI